MTYLKLTAGDTAPTLSGTINAVSTGATAVVHVKRADGTVISRAATSLTNVGDGTSTWTLALTAGDLSVIGTYEVELEVTFSSGKVQTFATAADGRPTSFVVRQQIA